MRKLFLYGAGKYGKELALRLQRKYVNISGFIDLKKAGSNIIIDSYSYPIVRIDDVDRDNVIVLIATQNDIFYGEIRGSCKAHGIPTIELSELIDINEIAYFDRDLYLKYASVKGALKVREAENTTKVRIGNENDGGYICIEEAINSNVKCPKIAYSIGIADDVSWDMEMADKYGYEVFQYDHTVLGSPVQNDKFCFRKIGLGPVDKRENSIMSLESMIKENGHFERTDMILKCDIEGAEWEVLDNIDDDILSKFSMIVMELHGFDDVNQLLKYNVILSKVNKLFQLVHLHGNNYGNSELYGAGDIVFTKAIEVTYLNKKYYKFKNGSYIVPQEIDRPCNQFKDDVILGEFGEF